MEKSGVQKSFFSCGVIFDFSWHENGAWNLWGYFSLGCTLAIQIFAPVIAMTSILFLVMGDMTAALIGRSFGQSVCSMKIGPERKKSVEGSAAMCLRRMGGIHVVRRCMMLWESWNCKWIRTLENQYLPHTDKNHDFWFPPLALRFLTCFVPPAAQRERERDNACSSRDNVSTTQFLPTKAVELFEVFGCTIFSPVHLREYAVVIGSLVATLTELYEPFGINDNVARQKGKKKNPQHS